MTQIIRWPGLIAFALLSSLITGVFFLFLDLWIKLGVIEVLEKSTGAEVNIANVSHTLSPFGVSLQGLQITDPKQPSHNQLQIAQAHAQIYLTPLLQRKVIIENLTVSELRFAQPRAAIGEVYRQPDETATQGLKQLLPEQPELPSVDELLAKSPLKTTKAIEEIQQVYRQNEQQLTQLYQQLPDKTKLISYQTRIKALTDTDYKDPQELLTAKKSFDKLREELGQEQQKINDFQQAALTAKETMSVKMAELKAAPNQDYLQLKALMSGDAAAINNITGMVFGQQATLWSQYLLSAYQIAAPLLGNKQAEEQQQDLRSEGRWLEFSDNQALPEFLIKNAEISLNWQDETIESHWKNITNEHDKIAQPTLFTINSTSSKLWQSLKIDGDLWLKDNGIKAQQKWSLQGLVLSDLALLDEEKLTSAIETALMSSNGTVAIDENLINGSGSIDLSQLAISAKGSNKLTTTIANTLSQLNSMHIQTQVKGNFSAPELSFTSDLDKEFTRAMLTNLTGEQQAQLQTIKQTLTAKIQSPLTDSNKQISQWSNWQELSNGSQNQIKDMLTAQFSNQLDKQKDKLKNFLKNKFSGG